MRQGEIFTGYLEACARDRREAYRRDLLDVATDIANARAWRHQAGEMVHLMARMEAALADYSHRTAIAALKAAIAREASRNTDSIIADAVAIAAYLASPHPAAHHLMPLRRDEGPAADAGSVIA